MIFYFNEREGSSFDNVHLSTALARVLLFTAFESKLKKLCLFSKLSLFLLWYDISKMTNIKEILKIS